MIGTENFGGIFGASILPPLSSQHTDRGGYRQKILSGNSPQTDNVCRPDHLQLQVQKRTAVFDLLWKRGAISWRATFDNIEDVYLFSFQVACLEYVVEKFSRSPHKWYALFCF